MFLISLFFKSGLKFGATNDPVLLYVLRTYCFRSLGTSVSESEDKLIMDDSDSELRSIV